MKLMSSLLLQLVQLPVADTVFWKMSVGHGSFLGKCESVSLSP